MPTKQKIIYAVLAVSLALNLFVIGAAGHYALKFRAVTKDTGWVEKRLDRAEESLTRHLDGADEDLARRVFAERRPQLLTALRELRAARKEFRTSLRDENADPQAIAAALDKSQAAADKLNENLHGAFRDMGLGLSPEARKKIARHMRRRDRND